MPAVTCDRDDDLDAFDIKTVCHRSGFGRSFIYEEIRAGRLIARKYGRLTRILRRDYEAWLSAAPRIAPMPPSTCTMTGPNSHPGHCPESIPHGDPPSKSTGGINEPPLDAIKEVGRRGVRPGAHR